ncbi:MAG: amidohydrolase family protein [Candidatus Rokubacteria bacterium]|nr:amidohydrolase family protein [Candidatus Rokubacteria bacterium]
MSSWFSPKDLRRVERAERAAFRSPVPTQVVSNGEYLPPPQTRAQREVEERIRAASAALSKRFGQTRREFLQSSIGMATAFVAMNQVFGPLFHVDPAEAQDPAAARERAAALAGQFILDDQTHHVHDTFAWKGILFLRDYAAGKNPERKPWNPALGSAPSTLEAYKFDRYVRDVFLDSDTKVALLSGFTTDTPENMALSSDQIVASRDIINRLAGSRRMLAHGLFWPGYPGYLDEMDRVAQQLKIDSWKGYTVGDPLAGASKYPWMLDDQRLAYPAYEKARKHGVRNICVHKGLMPADYQTSFQNWRFAAVDDLGRAAKDWPDLNFIIYHSAIRPFFDVKTTADEFERTGRIPWVSELAEIPQKYGVRNVYGEIGTSFGSTVVTYPRLAAGLLGILLKGLGADHVVWGSDSIWYGSPQWQIEALRRLEIPDDMQKKWGLAPLGPAQGLVKSAVFGYNSARLYGLDLHAKLTPVPPDFEDKLSRLKAEYEAEGPARSNAYHGWIRKRG